MNLREELVKPKLSEFIITIDLPIPPGEITAPEPQMVPATDFAQLNLDQRMIHQYKINYFLYKSKQYNTQ